METNKSVAVVHLVWIPYGSGHLKTFLASYKNHPASFDHDLIILFNGVSSETELNEYHKILNSYQVKYSFFWLDQGQDIEAYTWIANKLDYRYILFLNTFTEFLADNWLATLMNAIKMENVAIVGATGSWQSHYSSVFKDHSFKWEPAKSFRENFRKYKLFIKTVFYWSFIFPAFPNPHIRTSSFLVERNLFLGFTGKKIKSKFDAYIFESGKKGISYILKKKGMKLLIVGKRGEVYPDKLWNNSNTFWAGEQQNLLIADNQTRLYDKASPKEKRRLNLAAWGQVQSP
jgi:hypothetical protein